MRNDDYRDILHALSDEKVRFLLVGAYASRWAGYPRPHPLYKCDGLYLQALLARTFGTRAVYFRSGFQALESPNH